MHLLYCDETNIEQRSNDFFLYGGLCISAEKCADLTSQIDKLRKDAKVPEIFKLKFLPAPPGMSHQTFIDLKKSMIVAATDAGTKLLVSTILHNIATSPEVARRNAINTVCYHFDCHLNRFKSTGLVLIDRFSDKQIDAHLVDKFAVGVTGLPHASPLRLTNIVGFHYAAIGQSHFSSLIDIVIGSLRFAINAYTRDQKQNLPTARRILEGLQPLFFRETEKMAVSDLSFSFSPKTVKANGYRARYEGLKSFLKESGIDTAQMIQSG
ncbi:DUF3800 domain-containing protein [Bradyrhizobium mercantei]|uniref:DUF3800 domain-containing protein n=1 Tax=Bradyrhizobium mercantei TaxID=1904807 RepID=UPI0009772ECA|nr:DUF3800 domain-containing protein [Bradyrhizobium mercantei]